MPNARNVLASAVGVTAAAGLAAAAAKRFRDTESSGSPRVYHVTPNGEGWHVEAEGASRASSTHTTKREAVDRARELAHAHVPSRLVIHRADGSIQRQHTYEVEA